jgi:pyruvate formate lyase activating enzyme
MKGMIFNIQRYSIDDGPGIRSTVFLKGCPLRCLWCSNPESQKYWPEITHRDISCKKCGRCVDVCEVQAISIDEEGVYINRETCTRCGKCVEVCPSETLKVMGREVSVEEVLLEIKRDMEYYRNSGGGVTVSGGEPLFQPEFTAALLKLCREAGIHTCLDTSGYGDASALDEILPYTSLVFFDLKHTDPVIHKELTGQSNERILHNLELIAAKEIPTVIRIPLITGLNDSEEQIAAMARIVVGTAKQMIVNLLPYHRYGMGKYKMLDRPYKLGELERPTEAKLHRAKEIFEFFGISCEIMV